MPEILKTQVGNPDIRKTSQRKKENKTHPRRSFSSVMLVHRVNKGWFCHGVHMSSAVVRGTSFMICLQGLSPGQPETLDKMGKPGGQSFPPERSRDLEQEEHLVGAELSLSPKRPIYLGHLPTSAPLVFFSFFPPRTYLDGTA